MRQRRDLLTVAEKEAEDWCSSAEVRLSSDEACKRGREVGVQWLAEHEVVVAFAKLADDVGHPVPEFDWLENYDDPNEGGISGCVTGQWSPDDVHAFAQHHGIPTLLLDWTFSPCVAAFFAAEQPRSSGVQASELAVWALRKDVLSRDASEDDETAIEYASVPRYRLPFLLAQQGCFTYAPYGSRWFLKHGTWPSVDDLLQARARANGSALADRGTVLRKLTLPRAQAQPLLTLLWKERISRAHLMPTYDHVVEAVEWRLERLVEGDGSGGSAGN